MRQNSFLNALFLALAAWMIVRLAIQHLGQTVALVLVVGAGVVATALYLLRFERARAARLYRYPVARQVLDLVCRATRQQPPIEEGAAGVEDPAGLALKEPRDFEWARQELRGRVMGHRRATDELVGLLERNVLLRSAAATRSGLPPLGIVLLVGPTGVGKRHLATVLGRLLHPRTETVCLRLEEYPDDATGHGALLGTPGQEGHLTGPVKRHPGSLIVLENVDAASPKLADRLLAILTTGRCIDPASRTEVSFQDTVIVLTTTRMPEGYEGGRPSGTPRDAWRKALTGALTREAGLSPAVLGAAHEVLVCSPLDDLDRARVILLLMDRHCGRFGIQLDYVEPEILADWVAAFDHAHGFYLTEANLARWLHDPMARVRQHGRDRLVLTRAVLRPHASTTTTSVPEGVRR